MQCQNTGGGTEAQKSQWWSSSYAGVTFSPPGCISMTRSVSGS